MIPLEKLNQLKSQGKSEQDIIGILQGQGHNPRDITNALNQLKIKNAVNPGQEMSSGMSPSIMSNEEDPDDSSNSTPSQSQGDQQQNNQQPYTPQPAPQPSSSQQGYSPQQSQSPPQNNFNSQQNYNQGNQQQNNQQPYTPQTSAPQPSTQQQGYSQQNYPPQNYYQNQQYENNNAYPPQEDQQNYSPEDDYYSQEYPPQESYEQYEGYAQPYESTDTIIEISEQVFSEKAKELEDQIKELTEFKRIYEQRIDDMNERLRRIEKYFDKMQLAIMEKVTLFGKNIDHLQKEVDMVEDSFSKVVNPLTDQHSQNHSANSSHKRDSHKK